MENITAIQIKDHIYTSHQKVLQTATNITWEIYQAAGELFLELWNNEPIRHLGIHTSRVINGDLYRQPTLFDEIDSDKLERLDKIVDSLRKRFGMDSVMRASFIQPPNGKQLIDHMSGGISREKRTVDYSKVTID